MPSNISNLKVDKLNLDKLVPVPVDLSKLSDVVKSDVVKRDVYNAKIQNVEDVTNGSLTAKINEVKGEIPNATNLGTTAALTAVEKNPNASNLVKKTHYNTKVSESENKATTDRDHDKYITSHEFDKLTSENFTARFKQANLDNKLG